MDVLDPAAVTDLMAKILREEKNTGSPQILVSLMPLISSPISGRPQNFPMLFVSEWQVILLTILVLLFLTSPISAYPDGHAGSMLSEDEEIEHLKAKINSGADFIVTQLFYDVDNFLRWLRRIRSCGLCHTPGPCLSVLTLCIRYNRPRHSGRDAYSNICIISAHYKALWHTYPRHTSCRSGVHQGIIQSSCIRRRFAHRHSINSSMTTRRSRTMACR
jgi:hypothetical protein